MNFLSRRARAFSAFLLVLLAAGIYLVTQGRSFSSEVPEDFMNARLQGALISQNIVDLSNELNKDLQNVNELDKEKRFSEATTATNEILTRSQEIRSRAYDLSKEMETMARSLPDVKSEDARKAALESITSRLTLITRLVDYSNHLSDLLVILQARFGGAAQNGEDVSSLIQKINDEVGAINSFNQQASESMSRFDQIIKSN